MNTGFIRSIAILSGSSVVAQAINLIGYLILPIYFYSPAEFGVLGLFLAVYFVLAEIICLKMDQSIMLPESDEDASALLGLAVGIGGSMTVLVALILFLLNGVFEWFVPAILVALLISLFLGGFNLACMMWLNRKGRYWRMGNVRILQAVATIGGSVISHRMGQPLVNGLVGGFVLGQFASALALVPVAIQSNPGMAGKALVGKYNQFMKYGALSSVLSTLSRQLPYFFLQPAYGEAVLGWYTLATKYLNAPLGILNSSVSQVYFRDASRSDPSLLHSMTRLVIRNIILLALIPSMVILIWGAGLFQMVFGAEWQQAGVIAQVLVLWYLVAYAAGPVSVLLDIKLKLKWELEYNTVLLMVRALALCTVFVFEHAWQALGVYALAGILFNTILLAYVLKISRYGPR